MGRGRTGRFSESDKEEMLRLYMGGLTLTEISIKFDCHQSYIGKMLSKYPEYHKAKFMFGRENFGVKNKKETMFNNAFKSAKEMNDVEREANFIEFEEEIHDYGSNAEYCYFCDTLLPTNSRFCNMCGCSVVSEPEFIRKQLGELRKYETFLPVNHREEFHNVVLRVAKLLREE